MFDLYRMFDPLPSSFAQIFERVMKTVNQRGLTLFWGQLEMSVILQHARTNV
jgi:hypothetical protein